MPNGEFVPIVGRSMPISKRNIFHHPSMTRFWINSKDKVFYAF